MVTLLDPARPYVLFLLALQGTQGLSPCIRGHPGLQRPLVLSYGTPGETPSQALHHTEDLNFITSPKPCYLVSY